MIVERDEILARIKDRLDQAERGTGSLVLLGGEAGSGKSTVLREAVARWGDRVTVVAGACDPLITARPLGPFLEIAADPGLGLGHLVQTDRPAADLGAALVDELAAGPGAVLVAVEDLHWADDGTLDAIRFLGRRVERTRAVVVATYRSDEFVDSQRLAPVLGQLRRNPTTVHIEIPPLSLDAVRRLTTDAEANLDAEVVHRRTAGNAFFVSEVLAEGKPGSHVPGNVQAAVMARVAGLATGARHLVEAVAISPRALEHDHAVALSGAGEDAIDEAVAAGVLSAGQGRFEFRHELARLAVEQATPAGRRQRYHRALVERLVPVGQADADDSRSAEGRPATDVARIAHHAVELGDEPLILDYGIRAADAAEAGGALRQTCQFLDHALRVATAGSSRVDAITVAGWRLRVGSMLRLIGDFPAAIRQLEQAVDEYRRHADHAGHAAALRELSSAHRDIGERSKAEELADRAIAASEESGDPSVLARTLTQAAFLAMLARRSRTAVTIATRSLALAESSTDGSAIADAEHALACANLIGGDEEGGIAQLVQLERQAADRGDRARQAWLAVNLGSGCGEIRRYRESESWLHAAEGLADSVDMDNAADYSAAWLARVAFETGRWDEVAAPVDRALGSVVSGVDGQGGSGPASSFATVTALGALGRTRVRRGDPGGREALVKALELAADHDVQYLWPVACGLAEHGLWRSELDEGLAWLAPIHDRAMSTESAWARGETSYWLWRLGGLDTPPTDLAEPFALALAGDWVEAAAAWARLGCPYEQALALIEGDTPEPIGRAVTILDGLGARPAAQFARHRLRELGERSVPAMPRASTAANPASLTNRQREVLELLVGGLSNSEIAERLFVSKKTVEHHVSAIYGKLGVPDRPSAMVAGRALLSGYSTER